jgi:hypothetical protein
MLNTLTDQHKILDENQFLSFSEKKVSGTSIPNFKRGVTESATFTSMPGISEQEIANLTSPFIQMTTSAALVHSSWKRKNNVILTAKSNQSGWKRKGNQSSSTAPMCHSPKSTRQAVPVLTNVRGEKTNRDQSAKTSHFSLQEVIKPKPRNPRPCVLSIRSQLIRSTWCKCRSNSRARKERRSRKEEEKQGYFHSPADSRPIRSSGLVRSSWSTSGM